MNVRSAPTEAGSQPYPPESITRNDSVTSPRSWSLIDAYRLVMGITGNLPLCDPDVASSAMRLKSREAFDQATGQLWKLVVAANRIVVLQGLDTEEGEDKHREEMRFLNRFRAGLADDDRGLFDILVDNPEIALFPAKRALTGCRFDALSMLRTENPSTPPDAATDATSAGHSMLSATDRIEGTARASPPSASLDVQATGTSGLRSSESSSALDLVLKVMNGDETRATAPHACEEPLPSSPSACSSESVASDQELPASLSSGEDCTAPASTPEEIRPLLPVLDCVAQTPIISFPLPQPQGAPVVGVVVEPYLPGPPLLYLYGQPHLPGFPAPPEDQIACGPFMIIPLPPDLSPVAPPPPPVYFPAEVAAASHPATPPSNFQTVNANLDYPGFAPSSPQVLGKRTLSEWLPVDPFSNIKRKRTDHDHLLGRFKIVD